MNVWVNGTFDVLHRGHVEMLKYAATLGTLRVGIDYDQRVRELKGNTRPVNTWEDRKFMIENIVGVHSVVGFGTDEELVEQIKNWKTNVIVVGSDYMGKSVIGSEYSEYLEFYKKIDGYSTTKILSHEKDSSSW
jgi:D-beta-D-heptose 7-phosphate kinase/D-beta-D-heptose 1-phosphate adenosyltransferase